MSFLTIQTQDGGTERFDLKPTSTRIGRRHDNDLVLNDESVSRHHAVLEHRDDGVYISDLQSTTRTVINDTVISQPTRLRAGDLIRLGSTCLVFEGELSTPIVFEDRPPTDDLLTTVVSSEERLTPPPVPLAGERERQRLGTLELVLEADRQLALQRPLKELYQTLLDLGHRQVPFERGAVFTFDGDRVVLQAIRAGDGHDAGPIRMSRAIVKRVRRDNASVLIRDALVDPALRHMDSIREEQLRSVICVPLRSDEGIIGLLYVDNRRSPSVFTLEDLDVLRHLASIAAMKIEHRRLLEIAKQEEWHQLELMHAADIQKRLFPAAPPAVAGYRLHGVSDPCHAVGGDYFDYIQLPDDRLVLGFGDVAGKGLQAALIMAALHSIIRTLAEMDLPVEETVARVNRVIFRDLPPNRYSTLFYAVLDPREHRLTYVNAGHNPPLLVHSDGRIEPLPTCGPPVGMLAEWSYTASGLQTSPGDLLLCYSDGVTEAEDAEEAQFSEERLLRLVGMLRMRSPQRIVDVVRRCVRRHRHGAPMADDITLVALTREQPSPVL